MPKAFNSPPRPVGHGCFYFWIDAGLGGFCIATLCVLPFDNDEDFVPSENNTDQYQNGDEDYDIDAKPYRRSYKRRNDENGSKTKRKRLKKSGSDVANGDHNENCD